MKTGREAWGGCLKNEDDPEAKKKKKKKKNEDDLPPDRTRSKRVFLVALQGMQPVRPSKSGKASPTHVAARLVGERISSRRHNDAGQNLRAT